MTGGERSCQLGALSDAELSEDAREVTLDRPVGDEQRRRDLAIRLSLGDECRDPLLGGGERAGRRRTPADSAKLAPSPLRPERGAAPLEDRERVLQRGARISTSFRAALHGAERQERPTVVEWDPGPVVPGERRLVLGDRGAELARLCLQEPSAPSAVGKCGGALEPTSIALVPVEDLDGVVPPPELDAGPRSDRR